MMITHRFRTIVKLLFLVCVGVVFFKFYKSLSTTSISPIYGEYFKENDNSSCFSKNSNSPMSKDYFKEKNSSKLMKYKENEKLKMILFYTPVLKDYTKWITYYLKTDESPIKCRNEDYCRVTTNQSKIHEADAVLISVQDLPAHPCMLLPQDYVPAVHQKWIGFWQEAPTRSEIFGFTNETKPMSKLQALNDILDWTISYRSDADIVGDYRLSCYYLKRKSTNNKVNNKESILKMKDKSSLWVVSHCNTASKREDYVKELSQHINITIHGRCSTNETERKDDAFDQLDNYYFYLSFENSLCDEYITEKFMNTLNSNTVPVVMGAPRRDYERIAPPHSFIHISDFSSSKQLAQYLQHLQNNPDEYMAYLEWKQEYKLYCEEKWPCQLCHQLYAQQHSPHDQTNQTNQLTDHQKIQDFWTFWNQRKCYGSDYSYNSTIDNNSYI